MEPQRAGTGVAHEMGDAPRQSLLILGGDAHLLDGEPATSTTVLAPRAVDDVTAWLRRLQVVAVVLPVVSILGIYLIRPTVESALGVGPANQLVAAVAALALVTFSVVMFTVLGRGYRVIVGLAGRDRRRAILGERDRISREMHDNLAQVLATVHLRLRAVPDCCADASVRREITELADLCEASYRDVRESILALRVAGADGPDLMTSLRRYARECERHTGHRVQLDAPVGGDLHLSPDAEVQAMRIIQEALTNARKHAGTDGVTVRIVPAAGEVVIDVEDGGRGFDPDSRGDTLRHFGLRTMAERAALVGGGVQVDSRPGEGTRVRLRLPALGAPVQSGVGE